MEFNKEKDVFLEGILKTCFLDNWNQDNFIKNDPTEYKIRELQLNITYLCPQNCEYCYLKKFGDELYPKDIQDHDLILKNLKIFLNWLLPKAPYLTKIELFSGEIWHTQFGLDFLENLLFLIKDSKVDFIVVPSNMMFILSDMQTKKIQDMINKYEMNGIRLCFSASVDGFVIEDETRPIIKAKEGIRDEKFYDNLFTFCKKNNFGFHPMLASFKIEKWKENLTWWYNQCKKFNISFLSEIMLLEVRDNDWTKEKIESYKDFLKFNYNFVKNKIFNGDKHLMARYITGTFYEGECGYNQLLTTYNDDEMGCSICYTMTIRLGDLAWVPCHRTSYSDFIYGYFKINEKEEITGLEAKNPELACHILCANKRVSCPRCDSCELNKICLRQCYGNNFENGNDILFPIESVCNFFFNKYLTIREFIIEDGLVEEIKKDPSLSYFEKEKILSIFKTIINLKGDAQCQN